MKSFGSINFACFILYPLICPSRGLAFFSFKGLPHSFLFPITFTLVCFHVCSFSWPRNSDSNSLCLSEHSPDSISPPSLPSQSIPPSTMKHLEDSLSVFPLLQKRAPTFSSLLLSTASFPLLSSPLPPSFPIPPHVSSFSSFPSPLFCSNPLPPFLPLQRGQLL